MVRSSNCMVSPLVEGRLRRSTARTRAISSLGLNGLVT